MIQEDRLTKILELIEDRQTISVNEIQDTLYVSSATVRRDLAELARRGLIVRSFGGAVALTGVGRSVPKQQSGIQSHASPIGMAASELIPDRSTIFLGGSPATRSMLPALSGKSSVSIVTDSLSIAEALCGSVEHVSCTGGTYNSSLDIFTGKQAAETVSRFRFDYAFFTFDAVTADGVILDYCMDKLPVLNTLLKNARHKVLLAPKAVVGRDAAYVLARVNMMDIIITDAPDFFSGSFSGSLITV